MKNRTDKNVKDITDFILDEFDLSVVEEEVLESILQVFKERDFKVLKQIEHLVNDETEDLLELLSDYSIQRYACRELDLIYGNDESDLVDALETLNYDFTNSVSDSDMISSLENGGWNVTWDKDEISTDFDIVDHTTYLEIQNKFESLNWEGRERLKQLVINFS